MERLATQQEGSATGWEAWDAAPRDGPGVFVIDAPALDHRGELRGIWLDPTVGASTFALQLATFLGREPRPTEWSIVDQVGVGETMLPENFELPELDQILSERMP
jgi:hypothetical protein